MRQARGASEEQKSLPPPPKSTTVLQTPMYRSSKKNCSTIQHYESKNKNHSTWAWFEQALPKELDFKSSALDHSATTPLGTKELA